MTVTIPRHWGRVMIYDGGLVTPRSAFAAHTIVVPVKAMGVGRKDPESSIRHLTAVEIGRGGRDAHGRVRRVAPRCRRSWRRRRRTHHRAPRTGARDVDGNDAEVVTGAGAQVRGCERSGGGRNRGAEVHPAAGGVGRALDGVASDRCPTVGSGGSPCHHRPARSGRGPDALGSTRHRARDLADEVAGGSAAHGVAGENSEVVAGAVGGPVTV